jgi:WD40 repeat protein/tetratricopeptide (TPR) repeat protein
MMRRASKKIVCRVRVDETAKSVEFTWSEGSASFKPYALEGEQVADFRANVRAARDRLFGLVKHHEQPLDQRDPASYRLACLDLARAGRDLYNQIFDAAARDGEHVGTIADWLRDLTMSGHVESLELVCEGQPWFAPWNLVYDSEPDDDAFDGGPPGFAPFWGMRYNICGGQPVDPLRRMPLPANPRVLVVIDPVVLEGLRDYPDFDGSNQRDRLEKFLADHGFVPVASRTALERALRERRPHVIYWLGHAEPDALHLGPEKLDQTALRNLLRNMKKREHQRDRAGGLVFLNACRTAESGELGSFLKTFHDYEFSGLIATEEQTLDSFANPFGLGVLERFFTPGTPISSVLRDLRQGQGPLGLLYGAYCPPDLHIRPEEEPAAEEVISSPVMTSQGGRALGSSDFPVFDCAGRGRPLPEAPYLPLDAYGPLYRALFEGRDDDIVRCALILGRPESRLMVLHGESGVGKSSFLRAGLIPYLEEDCVGYRFLRDRAAGEDTSSVLFVRATDDPAGQIARALIEFASRPWQYRTPTGEVFEVDLPGVLAEALGLAEVPTASALAERLLANPALLNAALGGVGRAVPVTPVLVIDQAEEVFTLARRPDEQFARDRVLEMLRHVADGRGDYKLIVALRTEFYGRLVSALRRGLSEPEGVREYLLTDLDACAMMAVIRRPTSRELLPHSAETPFEKYRGFDYAEGVPETIARAVAAHGRADGVALLLQVVCAQLFERAMARDDHRVAEDDLKAIGGFEGALGRHAQRQIRSLFLDAPEDAVHPRRVGSGRLLDVVARGLLPAARNDRERFQMLLTMLTLRQVDGTTSTALIREEELRAHWRGRMPFEELIPRACELRLLRTTTRRLDSGREERLISLGHDALAKVAEPWKRELEQQAERRKWRNRGLVSAAAAVLFFGLTVEAVRDRNRAVRAQSDARTQEARAIESKNDALRAYAAEARERQEAERQRNEAQLAQKQARESATRAKIAAETASVNARRAAENLARVYVHDGARLLEQDRPAEALLLFAEAFVLDQDDSRRAEVHRRRLGAILRYSAKSPRILSHDGPINGAEFSPDGRRVVLACQDRTARIVDASTGRPVLPPLPHDDSVHHAAFSPDGRKVVTISDDRTVRLWHAETGKPALPPLEHGGAVHRAEFSPDGRRLVTAGSEHTARIWDAETGKPAAPPLRHGGEVRDVAFSPDGRRIATASYDNTARVWDAATGRSITSPLPHANWVHRLAFSPDGRQVVTACYDNTARVWDAATGRPITAPLQQGVRLTRVAFTADGRRIVTVPVSGEPQIWDVATARALPLPVTASWAHYPAYSRDGRFYLRSSPAGQDMRIEDRATGRPVVRILQDGGALLDAAFSPDGRQLVAAGEDKTARIWDASTGEPITPPLPHSEAVSRARWAPDGRRVVTVSNQEARVWDARTGAPVSPPLKQGNRIWSAALGPDGRRVVTAGAGHAAQLWDADTGAALGQALRHDNDVVFATFSPDGRRVLTASRDFTARLWDAATGRPVTPPLRHGAWVLHAAFSPDGSRVVTASDDRSARVWDAATGQPLGPRLRANESIVRAAFSPDGRRVATGGASSTARVWDPYTGTPLTPAIKHGARVRSVDFSPDGRLLLTSSDDKTARVWDAGTGEPISPPLKHGGWLREAIFSPDGSAVLTASAARRVCAWELPRDDRPVSDLLRLAHLISGIRLDPASGLVPCDPAALRRDWQELRTKYAEMFACSDAQVASWHRQEAHDAEAAGAWPVAVVHLKALLDSEPGSGPLHGRLARLLIETGQLNRALEEFDRAIALHSADPDLRYNRGRALGRLGRWGEARDDYSRSLEANPDDGAAWLRRHLAHAHLREWDKAEADYARAVELSRAVLPRVDCWWGDRRQGAGPAHPERWQDVAVDLGATPKTGKAAWWAWRARALAEAASGRWKEAIACFSMAIERKGDDWESWRGRGRANAELVHWGPAVVDCSRAIQLKGTDWGSWYLRAIARTSLGRADEAIGDCSRAIELGANGWGVWGQRGYASATVQDLPRAVADYTEVIRRNPDSWSYNNRGVAFDSMGEFDKAILDFDESIRLNARFALPLANRGETYRKKGDYARAIADSTEAIRIDPKSSLAYLYRAEAHVAAGQLDKAIDDYTEVLELAPSNANAFRRRAAAYLAEKDFGRAIDDYSELIRLIPSDVEAYVARSGAYLNNQEYGKAAADCAEVMRLKPDRANAWGEVFKSPDDVSRGEYFLRDTLAREEKAAADFPAVSDHRRRQASTQINLGHLYKGAGRLQKAEEAYGHALDIRKKLADDFPLVSANLEDLARSHSFLGRFLKENGRFADGVRQYRQAVELWRKLAKDSPGEPRYRESLAQSLDDLADTLRDSDKPPDADKLIREAGSLRQRLAADFPEEAKYQLGQFRGLVRLTNLLKATHELDEAEKTSGQAVAILVKLADHSPNEPIYQKELARAYVLRGDVLLDRGRAEEPVRAYRQAVTVRQRLAARFPQHPGYQNDLAWLLAISPKPEARDVPRAVDLAEKVVARAPENGHFWNTLGVALYRKGDWKGAIKALDTSMGLRAGGDSYDWFFLAMARWQLGEKDQARREYNRAVEGMAKVQLDNEELRHFRDEAAGLLGIPPAGKTEQARAK